MSTSHILSRFYLRFQYVEANRLECSFLLNKLLFLTMILQCDYYKRSHLDNENQTILQNGNKEFHLHCFSQSVFGALQHFNFEKKLYFSMLLYNM